MPLKADQKYDGKIAEGSYFAYSASGNLALYIRLECIDGSSSFPLWLTEKNREKAIKTLVSLGADAGKLSDQNYLDYELVPLITGKEVTFGTREETYQGKSSIKVSWIGKRTDPNVARGAAKFFSNTNTDSNATPKQGEIDDSDIPF
jgi:hypothetical protein